jgi:3'(2'), 5'-bisphosphate nucleotidase
MVLVNPNRLVTGTQRVRDINIGQMMNQLLPVAVAAGAKIMAIYASDFGVQHKADQSPVTEADDAAEAIIIKSLKDLSQQIPIVAEEQAAKGLAPRISELPGRFWLVDPLDGTREFIERNGEFTVNIALIDQGQPVLGIVLVPVKGRLFFGALGLGAFECDVDMASGQISAPRPITARRPLADGLVVVASRSHRDQQTDALIANLRVSGFRAAGSSLKFCLLAAGEADLYPRTGPTMEWDTAAGHGVLIAAGGQMTTLDGGPFVYGKPGFANPGFMARGLPDQAE